MNAATGGLDELIESYHRDGAPLTLIAATHALQRALDIYAQELNAYSEAKEAQRVVEQGVDQPAHVDDLVRHISDAMAYTREQIAYNVLKNGR